MEQIKQHDWFRKRPARTLDYLPFPPLALDRFQTFTMYGYLTELHQPSDQSNTGEQILIPDDSTSSYETRREQQNPSTINWNCSRTRSEDNLPPVKTRHRLQIPRICSLS